MQWMSTGPCFSASRMATSARSTLASSMDQVLIGTRTSRMPLPANTFLSSLNERRLTMVRMPSDCSAATFGAPRLRAAVQRGRDAVQVLDLQLVQRIGPVAGAQVVGALVVLACVIACADASGAP
jgi:hypothetical protein